MPHTPASTLDSLGSPPRSPPKRLYNVVDPATLSRIFAAAYAGTINSGLTHSIALANARQAVTEFINLVRQPADHIED